MKTANIPNKNKVYHNFKQYIEKNNLNSETILKELLKYSRYYAKMLNPQLENKKVQNYLQVILQLKSTVTYPYLLRLFEKFYGTKQIDINEFSAILEIINSYLIRRAIVNFPTNALNKVFSTLGKEAEKKKNEQSEKESVIEYLVNRTGSALFPRDEKLKDS